MVRLESLARPGWKRGLRAAWLGWLLAALLVPTVTARRAAALELANGVVVDPGAGTVYFMNPEGGIDAVEVGSGNVAWRSSAAARPISVSAAGLLAQVESSAAGRLELALLDAAGRPIRSHSVALPEGVEAPVADRLGNRFLVRGATAGGRIRVDWQSTRIPPRGALIRDGGDRTLVLSGGFTLDPVSGAVTEVASRTGALAVASVQVPTGQTLPVAGNQYLSADGSHRLATVPAAGPIPGRYEWSLYDAAGRRVGEVEVRAPYAPFHVGGGVVVVVTQPGGYLEGEEWIEERPSLRGFSLATGLELWSHEIRDTAYRGPYPP